jgi:hypothetical protein
MHPDERLRKSVKIFYAWLGSVLLAVIGPLVAIPLTHSESAALRIASVVIGVGAWIPIILVLVFIIRAGDEFVRRIHLVALALAFAGTLVIVSLMDWLERADFIGRPQLSVVWLLIAILWVIALIGTKRHYERPQ